MSNSEQEYRLQVEEREALEWAWKRSVCDQEEIDWIAEMAEARFRRED